MNIVFVTGTRADYGKLKPLIAAAKKVHAVQVFVTGMHLSKLHGNTWTEIEKDGFSFAKFDNSANGMDLTLAKTIQGFSAYVNSMDPDMIVVHGDRGESLAAAIVGAMNNVVVCHVEGGELSGTVDEHLRHAISKLSHIHCISHDTAKQRLIQMGEKDIHVIGSPDIDVMFGELPSFGEVQERYQIPFKMHDYGILLYHPVTTEDFYTEIETLVSRLLYEKLIVIYPNNDRGYEVILKHYERFDPDLTRVFPSMRFEHFLTLLKCAKCIVGNSSCGIIEAPYYGTPSINIGSRQTGRDHEKYTIQCEADDVLTAIKDCHRYSPAVRAPVNSAARFVKAIAAPRQVQKQFYSLN